MFRIEDLAKGKCALINDGSKRDLEIVLKAAFPESEFDPSGDSKFYYASNKYPGEWTPSNIEPNMYVESARELAKTIPDCGFNPKFGDKVMASQDGENWRIKKFIAITDNYSFKYAVTEWFEYEDLLEGKRYLEFYKFIKSPIITVTKKEIAEWKGCNVEDIKIV